eukprot:6807716-Alexandrium_andersonii.AAC.1
MDLVVGEDGDGKPGGSVAAPVPRTRARTGGALLAAECRGGDKGAATPAAAAGAPGGEAVPAS